MLQGMIAAFLGASTGTVLALAMGQFWLVGAVLGGLVGYLSYDIHGVVLAIRRNVGSVRWATALNRAPALFWGSLALTCIAQTLAILLTWAADAAPKSLVIGFLSLVGAFLGFVLGLFTAVSPDDGFRNGVDMFRTWAINLNIVVVVCYWVPLLLYRAAIGMYLLTRTAATLLWLGTRMTPAVLREVYSQKRLVAGMSALQGAVAGYYGHAWLLGGTVAVALYFLQVQLIQKRLVGATS